MADKEAADNINNSISPTFLIQAGEILESQGKKDEALKIYQDIKKNMSTLPFTDKLTSTSNEFLLNNGDITTQPVRL